MITEKIMDGVNTESKKFLEAMSGYRIEQMDAIYGPVVVKSPMIGIYLKIQQMKLHACMYSDPSLAVSVAEGALLTWVVAYHHR